MKLNKIENKALCESYCEVKHPSGLTILILHKPDYAGTHAIFATNYGSIDTVIKGENGFYEIPEGTAHFLEHKLFESEDLDAFERFAKTGASANAFTSFDRTAYIFTCSERFDENLEILLDFVRSPYFTQETVQKEQGIIGQEIRMYKDVAQWQVLFNLLQAVYHHHPVKVDIAGTEASIAKITADTLYDCYNNFYDLNNMVLAVAGKATPEQVLAVADKMLKPSNGCKPQRLFKPEPPTPVKAYTEQQLAVQVPQFLLGYKEDIKTPSRSLRELLCTDIIHEAIAGRSSPLYSRLLNEGLINMSFSSEYFNGFGFACSFFGGESTDPQKASDELRAAIAKAKREGICEADFERARRKAYGSLVMMFNEVEDIAQSLVDSYFEGEGLFDEAEILKSLTIDDINDRLAQILNDDYCALSVIKPIE